MTLSAGTAGAVQGSPGTITADIGGRVTCDPTSWFTGSGAALALAKAYFQNSVTQFISGIIHSNPESPWVTGQLVPNPMQAIGSTLLGLAQGAAQQANTQATVLLDFIVANAVIPAGGLLDSGGHPCTGATTIT